MLKRNWSGNAAQISEGLAKSAADKTLAVGPLVWQPTDGTKAKVHCFMVGTVNKRGKFHVDRVVVDNEMDRLPIIVGLIAHRSSVVIDFDDELEMARRCEQIWPCEKTTRLRDGNDGGYAVRVSRVTSEAN